MAFHMDTVSIPAREIVKELNLPPVKIHCSVLAEDAIKAAIADYKKKHVNVDSRLSMVDSQ